MANIKFSAFTQKAVTGNVDFLVGYTGADNVRISPAIFSDTYLPLVGGTLTGTLTINNNTPLIVNGSDPLIAFQNGAANHWQVGFENTQSDRFVFYDNNAAAYQLILESTSGNATFAGTVKAISYTGNAYPYNGEFLGGADVASANLQAGSTSGYATGVKVYGGGNATPNIITMTTASVERMRIDSAGNVGIGDNSPQGKLEVNNRNTATGAALFIKGGEDDLSPIAGQYTGLAFGYGGGDIYNNAAILWEFTNSAANGKLHFAVNPTAGDGTANLSDSKMTILDSGNVGIGTDSPLAQLEVAGANQPTGGARTTYGNLLVSSTDAYGADIGGSIGLGGSGNGAAGTNIYTFSKIKGGKESAVAGNDAGYMAFETGNGANTLVERMRIDSSGNVGIGVTAPTAKLDVKADQGGMGAYFFTNSNSAVSDGHVYINSDQVLAPFTALKVRQAGTGPILLLTGTAAAGEVLRVTSGGDVGIGTDSPTTMLHLDQASNDRAGGLYIERNGSNYGLSMFVNAGGYGIIGSNGDYTTDILTLDLNGGNVGIGAAASDGNFQVKKAGVNTGITNVLMNASFSEAAGSLSGLSIGYRTDETTAVIAPRTATGNLAFYSFDGGWSESMRITNTGYVGIGTDSPSRPLSVNSSQISARFTSSSADSQIEVVDSSGTVVFGSSSSSAIVQAGGAERMRVTSTGIVQVNPTNASTGGIVNSYRAAISVSTSAIAISNPATYGGLASVWVNSAGNIAHDLVSYSLSGIDVVASQPISGAAAARTYTAVSGVLKVAMAAGTYDVYATETRVSLT